MGQFSCKSAARQLYSVPDKLCCFTLKCIRYFGIRFGIPAIVDEPNPPQPHTDIRRQRPHILRSCQNSKALLDQARLSISPSFRLIWLLFRSWILSIKYAYVRVFVFPRRTLKFLSNTFSNTLSKNVQTWASTIVGLQERCSELPIKHRKTCNNSPHFKGFRTAKGTRNPLITRRSQVWLLPPQ